MKIDPQTGRITLPGGFSFDANLTRDEFEAQGLHDPASRHGADTAWVTLRFTDGLVEGHPLKLGLTFYDQTIVSLTFCVDLRPLGAASWDDFSYATEEQIQKLHARLLLQWLGPPHKTARDDASLPREVIEAHPALADILTYQYHWGEIWCGHDPRSSGTEAGVRFAKNDKWARNDWARRRLP